MKTKRPIILVVCGVLVLVCAWYFTTPPAPLPAPYSVARMRLVRSNLQARILKHRIDAVDLHELRAHSGWKTNDMPSGPYVEPPPETNEPPEPAPIIDPKYSNPTNWPVDARPGVKEFYRFAKVAKLYKFDPIVTYYKDEASSRSLKAIETSTYEAEVDTRNNKFPFVGSKYDSMENMADHPEAKQSWTSGNGAWNQDALIEQTLNILQEFAFTNTVQGVLGGRREVQIPEYTVTSPDGERLTYHPFATVILHDATHDEQGRVKAEYRLDENGLAQLVRWSAW